MYIYLRIPRKEASAAFFLRTTLSLQSTIIQSCAPSPGTQKTDQCAPYHARQRRRLAKASPVRDAREGRQEPENRCRRQRQQKNGSDACSLELGETGNDIKRGGCFECLYRKESRNIMCERAFVSAHSRIGAAGVSHEPSHRRKRWAPARRSGGGRGGPKVVIGVNEATLGQENAPYDYIDCPCLYNTAVYMYVLR